MGAFLAYNLKLSVCFILFYVVYRLLFCRNTFYRSNRLVLLSAYFFSLCIPLLNIPTAGTTEIHEFIGNYEIFLLQTFDSPVTSMFEQASLNWADIVVAIYVTGVFFFILRYVYFTIRIKILIGAGKKINLSDGITLVVNEKNAIPFTWMNYIIVSKADYLENNENILRHEAAHIKYRHSVDLLIA